jgi:hypothetical protein
MKKSIWRLILGLFLLAGVANSLRKGHLPNPDPSYVITYVAIELVLASLGVWLLVSYFRRSN